MTSAATCRGLDPTCPCQDGDWCHYEADESGYQTLPITHEIIVVAIERSGGRLTASFTLDADGETIGLRRTHNRRTTCGACGEPGHTIARCNGPGQPPRPTYAERREQAAARRAR